MARGSSGIYGDDKTPIRTALLRPMNQQQSDPALLTSLGTHLAEGMENLKSLDKASVS